VHDHGPGGGSGLEWVPALLGLLLALLAAGAYVTAVLSTSRNPAARGRRPWPRHRSVLWLLGVLAAGSAVIGPLADAAHASFEGHVVAHLLLGMLAPLLLVLAAPVTLLLRTLPVTAARRLSRVLASVPVRILTEPVVAALLNVGGLWLLYTTGLFPAMPSSWPVYAVVHAHMLAAGYLFTLAIVGVDPLRHRRSFGHRAVVLIAALAAHDVLAKYLYAHPPIGVPADAARSGAMIMYYGGDAVDLAMIVLLCAAWYRSRRRRSGTRHSAPLDLRGNYSTEHHVRTPPHALR
jgi:putative membrane protein